MGWLLKYWVVCLLILGTSFGQQDPNYFISPNAGRFVPSYERYRQPQYRQQNYPQGASSNLFQQDNFNVDDQTFSNPSYNSHIINRPINQQPFQINDPFAYRDRPAAVQPTATYNRPFKSTQFPPKQQFSHLHSHDPSQSEQFLGQITLQSPNTDFGLNNAPDYFPEFVSTQKKPQSWRSQQIIPTYNDDNTAADEDLGLDLKIEDPILRKKPSQRSRFGSQLKNNDNGEFVYQPKNPSINNVLPSTTTTTQSTVNRGSTKFKAEYLSDYKSKVQPLLEDQIASNNDNNYKNSDVEVVQATENSSTEETTHSEEDVNVINHEEGHDEVDNPDDGHDEVDHEVEEEQHEYHDEHPDEVTTTEVDYPTDGTDGSEETDHSAILLGEAVVSVVTTKSVVNGTISVPEVTPTPELELSSTKKMTVVPSTTESLNAWNQSAPTTTESWVVVASVQTSRSVSGARFLPFDTIAQEEEKTQSLSTENTTIKVEDTSEEHTETTPEKPTPPSTEESIVDKLDRVQSELSSRILNNNDIKNDSSLTVLTDDKLMLNTTKINATTSPEFNPVVIRKFQARTTTVRPTRKSVILSEAKEDDVSKFLPPDFKPRYSNNRRKMTTTEASAELDEEKPQGDQPLEGRNMALGRSIGNNKVNKLILSDDITTDLLPKGYKLPASTEKPAIALVDDISKFLPPGFKFNKTEVKPVDDISAFLPKGFKPKATPPKLKPVDDISAFLPPGFKLTTELPKVKPIDDISKFLPPGFKLQPTEKTIVDLSALLPPDYKINVTKPIEVEPVSDISKFLPPGFKLTTEVPVKPVDDISAFLPPGFKLSTEAPIKPVDDISAFLPPGFKLTTTTKTVPSSTVAPVGSSAKIPGFRVPGAGTRKPFGRITSTARPNGGNGGGGDFTVQSLAPTIRKGPPTRVTTEFTGWPTPSTTPISIEKLLEAARTATGNTSPSMPASEPSTTTTTTTTSTTTTPRPTTPGICSGNCDLAGTIKLVGGAKWVPELLDHNTKEWQLLANEVQTQLEAAYSKSDALNRWYKKIRIDGFSEGSVLVDYFVELNDLGRLVDTQELKRLFHKALHPVPLNDMNNLDESDINDEEAVESETARLRADMEGKLNLGGFIVDPNYTDFIVIPKQISPTVGYADENVLLPQWAIAVIVIGLASLLFVIIFGVTVLVNRQKNAKKRQPTPLTEDMLNELNKNHMGGIDNYGAEDLYNMEDVWNDRPYDKLPKKVPKNRSNGSLQDNSMSNLYDSWRSEWNGFYYNAYYGNPSSSASAGGYGRRRSDYDTNF